jgi:hypothetical protein
MHERGRMQHQRVVIDRDGSDRPRLFLSVAGVTAAIESDEPDLDIQPPGVIGRFVTENAAPDLTVRTRWAPPQPRPHGQTPVFESGGAWRLHRTTDHFIFDFTSSILPDVPYKTAYVNQAFTEADVTLHRPCFCGKNAVYPLEYPLDELMFIHLLAQGRGVEIHGCAVVDSTGAAYLFVGPSGAGKSTMARLWHSEPDVTILSDDRIIVRVIDGQTVVYGTPWHGDEPFATSGPARLKRIFFLRHASAHRLKQLTVVDAAARLFACSFVPFYDANAVDFTLAFLTALSQRIPCHELRFAPDRSIVDFIRGSAA